MSVLGIGMICAHLLADAMKGATIIGKAINIGLVCKGCGLCMASCRQGTLQWHGFDDAQTMAMIEATRKGMQPCFNPSI